MYLNPRRAPYAAADRSRIGMSHAAEARDYLGACPAHQATSLIALPTLAAELGVAEVHIKAEWSRMGLGSFKALGGGYAVARLIRARAEAALGRAVEPRDLSDPAVRALAGNQTMACASAGNHGLSVAAAARAFGARAIVYLAETVPEPFARRLRAKAAEVRREGAIYEDSMARATSEAGVQGWDLISDSSWPGYSQTPLNVMRGYTVLLAEAAETLEQAGGPASHVFVQAGVGGLAAAAAAYLRDRWGEAFKFIVVEPEGAPCLLESVRQGRFAHIEGAPTTLGRLDCKEPSLIAFELLSNLADAFVLISDAQADQAAERLAAMGAPVSSCGAAGAAGLLAIARDPDARARLGLTEESRVLLIGTEAANPA